MVNLKTDKLVQQMGWISFNPRIKMRGYPELADDRVKLNPLIHQWDNLTPTYSPLSVSTDYHYLRINKSGQMTGQICDGIPLLEQL